MAKRETIETIDAALARWKPRTQASRQRDRQTGEEASAPRCEGHGGERARPAGGGAQA